MITPFKNQDLEILISTMNQSSLEFLIPMFPFCSFYNFSILIINQTNKDQLIFSDVPSVRVINSFEKGLSKSRNLALKNARGKILLIADDDLVYKEGFDTKIIKAHNDYSTKSIISFCIEKTNGFPFKKYFPIEKTNLTYLELFAILSVEISINRSVFEKLDIKFDENFGLGSIFEMGEEAIFLTDIKNKNSQIAFVPISIATHPEFSSNEKLDCSQRYYVQGAFLTRVIKTNYYINLAIKIFFDLKQKKLKLSQVLIALKNASQGKTDFTQLKNKINV